MRKIDTYEDVIGLWPSARVMAEEVGVHPEAVPGWKKTNSIPAKYWLRIIDTPTARRAKLSLKRLAEMAASS